MSRIAGTITCGQEFFLNPMLAAMQPAHGWEMHARNGLGWTGLRTPNIAGRNNVTVVMDGAIFNRKDFPHCTSSSYSDADIFLDLYERHGFENALKRINGDFAAAVFDGKTGILWLGRDRIGIRPLYYTTSGGGFAFASRPGALLLLPGITREVNEQFTGLFAGSHYRTIDNDPEASPFAHIRQLPAACMLRLEGDLCKVSNWWSLKEHDDFQRSEDDLAEEYRALLMDAVDVRLKTAANPAFTLSGGMDSSSVLACTTTLTGRKQHAFSSVYADKTYDESDEIRSMLDQHVEEWHQVQVGSPDIFALVEQMTAAHDEPVATSTWLSHFLLCEQAAGQGFGSLFGGLGGDELNAGEYEYFVFHFADLHRAGKKDALENEIAFWAKYHDHPIYKKSRESAFAGMAAFTVEDKPGRCLPDLARLGRYAKALHQDAFNVAAFVPVMDHPFTSCLKNRSYQDIFRETAPCCIRAQDRQSLHFGMETFLPFFDYRLVEFMFRIPGEMKIRDGVTKHLLRKAMAGVLPEETRARIKKTGWNAPAHVWFSEGQGYEQLMDMVRSQRFRERGLYNVEEVERIIAEHVRITASPAPGSENHMMFLWQLVNMETWLCMYVDAPITAGMPQGNVTELRLS